MGAPTFPKANLLPPPVRLQRLLPRPPPNPRRLHLPRPTRPRPVEHRSDLAGYRARRARRSYVDAALASSAPQVPRTQRRRFAAAGGRGMAGESLRGAVTLQLLGAGFR